MWEFREERQQFYLHQYLIQQPDLNYRNPQLKELMFDAIKFWMDAGVDGFRLDAVTKLIEDDRWLDEPSANNPDVTDPGDWLYYNHMYTNNMPETRDILKEFYDLVKTYEVESRSEERVMMLEAWLDIDSTMMYYECGDFPFNFGFVNLDERPSADEIKEIINLWLDNLPEGKTPNWVVIVYNIFKRIFST
jgi:alpha-glucosidase